MSRIGRLGIINALVEKYNYSRYLEIGIENEQNTFNHVKCPFKIGVDPAVRCTHQMTSNEFFQKHGDMRFDIIFIDGLHLKEQVILDIENALNSLIDGGTIVVHDCLPVMEVHQFREWRCQETASWTGDVWKAWAHFRRYHDYLEMAVVDTDWGVGIIQKEKRFPTVVVPPGELTWEFFQDNRDQLMNVISVGEFTSKFLC